MKLSLAQIQEALGTQFCVAKNNHPALNPAEIWVTGWTIDSRAVAPGDLFFAIRGEHQDGNQFVQAALQAGAVAAIASEHIEAAPGPVFCVGDTVAALQDLARWARERWHKRVVAVTGSAGKTTTKDVIAELLGTRLRVTKTSGNFNNHIGLPLSLLRSDDDADVGVFELGMNHAGEIRFLSGLAKPDIGVVTNVGYAHVEAFDSIDGIAGAKRELIESLPPAGVAVLNADDARVARFRDFHRGRTVTYGLSPSADVRATDLQLSPEGSTFNVAGALFRTRMTGAHAVSNILAGLAVASLFGIEPASLVDKVADLKPGKMRGERTERRASRS
jgi:UDP-N-acetylmuramoyl-tripeptide--D-alanyl-D-alanine ligase